MHLFCPHKKPALSSGCVLGLKLLINMRISPCFFFFNGKRNMVSSCGFAYIFCLHFFFLGLVSYSVWQYVVIQILWLMLIYEILCKYLRTYSNNVQVKQFFSSKYWNDKSKGNGRLNSLCSLSIAVSYVTFSFYYSVMSFFFTLFCCVRNPASHLCLGKIGRI